MKITIVSVVGTILAFCLFSCNGMVGNQTDLTFDDFVADLTGYVGEQAAEFEANCNDGKVYIDLSDTPKDDRERYVNEVLSQEYNGITGAMTDQLRYGRNQLMQGSYYLSMDPSKFKYTINKFEYDANGVWIFYSTQVDFLVPKADLENMGQTPQQLIGSSAEAVVPIQPATIFNNIPSGCQTAGPQCQYQPIECASNYDDTPVNPSDLDNYSYFYYFNPFQKGCPLLELNKLTTVHFEITKYTDSTQLDENPFWPEYDVLVQDGNLTMVAMFGQIEHGDLFLWDLGWRAYNYFTTKLESVGFTKTNSLGNEFGATFEKVADGLTITVDCYSPAALADHRDYQEKNNLFHDAMLTHELFYYNGHSFYGSLNLLTDPTAYPRDTYQIFFMDSCWSYSYYNSQVFASKLTTKDPSGTKYADVINNNNMGITGSEITTFELYKSIFEGAALTFQGKSPEQFSWNNLIKYMNISAKQRAGSSVPEMYGVSGVRDNCYTPTGSRCPILPENNTTPGDNCSNPIVVAPDIYGYFEWNGWFEDYSDDFPQEENGLHDDLLGNDIVFQLDLQEKSYVQIETLDTTVDTALYITYDDVLHGPKCGDPNIWMSPIASFDNFSWAKEDQKPCAAMMTTLEPGTWYIILDSQVANAKGRTTLFVYTSPMDNH